MKNLEPLISIVIATYNAGDNLQITINYIRELNYKNTELIIIDGGSKDNTLNIINLNKDIISSWISESDYGIYDAWNKGIVIAKGEWIAFLGAGDCYISDGLNIYIELISRGSNDLDFISSQVKLVNKSKKTVKIIGMPFSYKSHKKYMKIAHVGALHKKNIFEKFGLFNIGYQRSGDYEFLMRCGQYIRAGYINKITAFMITGGISGSYQSLIETYNIQKIYSKQKILPKINLYIAIIKYFYRLNFKRDIKD